MAHLLTLYKSWRYAASIGFSDNCLHDVHLCSLPSGLSSYLYMNISRKTYQSGSKSFTRGVLLPSVHHMMTACANCCACIEMKIFALHSNDCVVCYKCLCLVGDQICPVTGQYVEKDAGSRPHLYLNKSNSILS
ncbi:unnamed protein product [Sphagnum compactum]